MSEKYIAAFYEDMDKLGILRADMEPKATQYIGEMIKLAEHLISTGYAYSTPSGDVYFRVRAFKPYGKLSGRNLEELQSGARVAPGEEKEDPLDFALWKAAKARRAHLGEPVGTGQAGLAFGVLGHERGPSGLAPGYPRRRPGPHLSPTTRTRSPRPKQPRERISSHFWVHNGFVQINSEKMSKSLGNFVTIRDIFGYCLPEVLRFFLVTSHYRSPLDYSTEALDEAEKAIKRIYSALAQMDEILAGTKWSASPAPKNLLEELATLQEGFDHAMEDDLNTAAALGHIFGMVRLAGRIMEDKGLRKSQGGKEILARIRSGFSRYAGHTGHIHNSPGRVFARPARQEGLAQGNRCGQGRGAAHRPPGCPQEQGFSRIRQDQGRNWARLGRGRKGHSRRSRVGRGLVTLPGTYSLSFFSTFVP